MTLDEFFTEFEAVAQSGGWTIVAGGDRTAIRRKTAAPLCDCPLTAVARAHGMTRTTSHPEGQLTIGEWDEAADYLALPILVAQEIVGAADAYERHDHELRQRLIDMIPKGAQA